MQRNDRRLAWAAIFSLAVIALELAIALFIGPTNHHPDNTTDQKADYWEWIFSAAFWTTIFTGVLTWSTIGLWLQTRRLAEGAERQSAITERPWIGIISVTPRNAVRISTDAAHAYFNVRIINTGKSPALDAHLYVEPFPISGDIKAMRDTILNRAKPYCKSGLGTLVSPGQEITFPHTIRIEKNKSPSYKSTIGPVHFLPPQVLFCITYRSPVDGEDVIHQTAVPIDFGLMHPGFPHFSKPIEFNPGVVRVKDLATRYGPFGSYAD